VNTMLRSSDTLVSDPQYARLKEHLIESTGLMYYADKDVDLARRVGGRLATAGAHDCASYLDILCDPLRGPSELDALIAEITIGETYFFRHQEHFDALRDLVLPDLIRRNQASRSLRIWCAGCSTGQEVYSVAMLVREHFPELARWSVEIVGVDIDANCKRYDAPADGIHVRIGSQDDPAFLEKVVAEFGRFDLIIDDGSHQSSHIIGTFNYLFAYGLKETGIYFVEDLHANYWRGWRDSRKSFLDICKELLEHMNAHYQDTPPGAFLVEKPSAQPMDALLVPAITTMIEEIRFFDSIVAIYKAKLETVPFLVRGA